MLLGLLYWDYSKKKKERKKKEKKRVALSLVFPNSYFYNKRCNMLL